MYTEEEQLADKERALQAFDELLALQNKYSDVIAVIDVVAVHDIAEYRISTNHGIKQIKEICDKKTIGQLLDAFANANILLPEIFEDVITRTLRETNENPHVTHRTNQN